MRPHIVSVPVDISRMWLQTLSWSSMSHDNNTHCGPAGQQKVLVHTETYLSLSPRATSTFLICSDGKDTGHRPKLSAKTSQPYGSNDYVSSKTRPSVAFLLLGTEITYFNPCKTETETMWKYLYWWNTDNRKPMYLEEKPVLVPLCPARHMVWIGIEPGPPRWEAGN